MYAICFQGEANPHAELCRELANIRIGRGAMDEKWIKLEKSARRSVDEWSRAVDGQRRLNNRAGVAIIIFETALLIHDRYVRRRGK